MALSHFVAGLFTMITAAVISSSWRHFDGGYFRTVKCSLA